MPVSGCQTVTAWLGWGWDSGLAEFSVLQVTLGAHLGDPMPALSSLEASEWGLCKLP